MEGRESRIECDIKKEKIEKNQCKEGGKKALMTNWTSVTFNIAMNIDVRVDNGSTYASSSS